MSRDYIAIPKQRSYYEIDDDYVKPTDNNPKNSIVAYPIPSASLKQDLMVTSAGVSEPS